MSRFRLYQVLVSTPSVTIFLNAHSLQVTEDLIPTWPENAQCVQVSAYGRWSYNIQPGCKQDKAVPPLILRLAVKRNQFDV